MPAADVPADVLSRLRGVCLALPEAYEEQAWVGVRWLVRKKTFAHVLVVDSGWPPAYARAAGTNGPVTLLMFRSAGAELDALRHTGRPMFAPPWRGDEVGMVLEAATDWADVTELVAESYCVRAPTALVKLLDRPVGDDRPR